MPGWRVGSTVLIGPSSASDGEAAMRASISRRLSPRLSNLALLSGLLLAFATGAGAVATGSPGGRWVVVAHGAAGMAVFVLIPWKGHVIRRGLRRARRTRWASLLLAAVAIITLVTGVGYSTGLIRSIGAWLPGGHAS